MKKSMNLYPAAVILALALAAVLLSGTKTDARDVETKLRASRRTEECFAAVKKLREEMELDFSADDINKTGLIGQEYSFITTTLGNLEAKRTSVNPNWAAVIVQMFGEAGLRRGDRIAVNCSGSFPALNMAVICAGEEYGLDMVVMSSFGASTHGANEPELTWQDMEHRLYELGLIKTKSRYFSIGGRKDIGSEMDKELADGICERLKGYGYEMLYEEDLIKNIEMRHSLYKDAGEINCFVNVGGNDVSFGDSKIIVYADGGILTELPDRDRSTGLVQLFLRENVPVIHLLNIKGIAGDYALPIDPETVPEAGEGEIYSEIRYSRWLALAGLAAGTAVLLYRRKRVKGDGSIFAA